MKMLPLFQKIMIIYLPNNRISQFLAPTFELGLIGPVVIQV
jgi:hypothetical protein